MSNVCEFSWSWIFHPNSKRDRQFHGPVFTSSKYKMSHQGFSSCICTAESKNVPKCMIYDYNTLVFLTFHHCYGCSGHLRLCRYYSASEIGWLILPEKQYFVRMSLKGHANKVFRYENHWVFFTLSSPISHTNSSAWSPYISLQSYSREFDEKLKHFFFGDHFTNSQNLFSWLWMDIVGKKLTLVTLAA